MGAETESMRNGGRRGGTGLEGGDAPLNARPAVIDGTVVWLPTLVGLMRGETGTVGAPNRDLWSAMAAAVLSEQAFGRLDAHLADGGDLSGVIDPGLGPAGPALDTA